MQRVWSKEHNARIIEEIIHIKITVINNKAEIININKEEKTLIVERIHNIRLLREEDVWTEKKWRCKLRDKADCIGT